MSVSSYTAAAEQAAAERRVAFAQAEANRQAKLLSVVQELIATDVIPATVVDDLRINLNSPQYSADSVFFGGSVVHDRYLIDVCLRVTLQGKEAQIVIEFGGGNTTVRLSYADDPTLATRVGSAILAEYGRQYTARHERAARAVGRISNGADRDDIEAVKDLLDSLTPVNRRALRSALAKLLMERMLPERRRQRRQAEAAAAAERERAQLTIAAGEFSKLWEAWDAEAGAFAMEQTARLFRPVELWSVEYDTEDGEPLAAVVLALPDAGGRAVEVLAGGRTRRVVFYRPIVAREMERAEMTIMWALPYYRSWEVGRFFVNVPPNSTEVPGPVPPAPSWADFIAGRRLDVRYANLRWQELCE